MDPCHSRRWGTYPQHERGKSAFTLMIPELEFDLYQASNGVLYLIDTPISPE